MAAGGFRTFVAGETLDEDKINDFLMQGVLVFADATARDAAITSPVHGQVAFLKDVNETAFYDGSSWEPLSTGVEFEYLIIAGGAGGGGVAGGGGAGGYRNSFSGELSGGSAVAEPLALFPSGSYTVTVGAGGAGAPSGGSEYGSPGSQSFFGQIYSVGGGAGASGVGNSNQGGRGGSGGGGGGGSLGSRIGPSFTGQGQNGGQGTGNSGGGGGGAGVVGANAASTSSPGAGGAGLASSATGSSVTRAGGGGGAGLDNVAGGAGGTGGGGAGGGSGLNPVAGTVNTGSGGGAGGSPTLFANASRAAAAGGSGLVVLKYPSGVTLTIGAGLTSTTSTAGGFKTTIFTAGTDTVSF
jgi:hypothetical protein